MKCKYCCKNKNISKFRKNRKTCIKCEYQTRKEYFKKYQQDNKEKLNQYNKIYGKSKNWFYVPRPKKPKIIIDKNKVRTLTEKPIDLNIDVNFFI